MTITMNQIPINILVPGAYIEIDNSQAFRGLSGMPTKVLVIGQKTAGGTAAALTPLLITSADQARQYFGEGSMLANMLERFKRANSFIECHAIAQVDEVAGVAATAEIAFTGPAAGAGVLNLYIAGRRVRAAVSAGNTASQIATAIAAAITAEPDLPVTAAVDLVDTHIVNVTARNKGECGNDINIQFNYYQDEQTPAGVGTTITAMANGAGNPDVADVIDAIGDTWYTDIVMPYTDSANLVAMAEELEARWSPLKMIDGVCWTCIQKTHAQLVTSGQGRNSQLLTVMGEYKSPVPPYEWAAVYAAVAAYALKIDPARPVQTLPLTGLLPPVIANRFTIEEQNILLENGISTFAVGDDGVVRISRAVTAYRENPTGAADPSYRDVETIKTLSFLRYDLRTFIALRYPRHKLANDGTNFAQGQAIVTPGQIRAALIGRFRQWEEQGLVENIDDFIENLIVERDANDVNRVNALIPPDIINQLRVFAGKVEFRL